MYKLDKTVSAIKTYRQAEENKKFASHISLSERLQQAWCLTAMAFGIDPGNPPRMEKRLVSIQKRKK